MTHIEIAQQELNMKIYTYHTSFEMNCLCGIENDKRGMGQKDNKSKRQTWTA